MVVRVVNTSSDSVEDIRVHHARLAGALTQPRDFREKNAPVKLHTPSAYDHTREQLAKNLSHGMELSFVVCRAELCNASDCPSAQRLAAGWKPLLLEDERTSEATSGQTCLKHCKTEISLRFCKEWNLER